MAKPSKDLPQFKWIDLEDFEFICFRLAKELLEFNEPIPDYSKTDIALLESSLAAPRHAFEFSDASLAEQSSVLFYSLIKNHAFENGNKRIAVAALLVFLHLNDKWIEINPQSLYKIAVSVAESKPFERNLVIKKNKEILEKFIIDSKL